MYIFDCTYVGIIFVTIFQVVPMYQMPDYLTAVSVRLISSTNCLLGAEARSILLVEREVTRIVHFRIQASNFAELLIGISCLQNVF